MESSQANGRDSVVRPHAISARHGGRAAFRLAVAVAAMAMAMLPPMAARCDSRSVLSGLVGHSKAELIQRFGFPNDAVTTIDGEILIYDTLDAGQVGGRSGRGTRAGGFGSIGPYARSYSFRCRTELVIRNGVLQAFNRSGNDCG